MCISCIVSTSTCDSKNLKVGAWGSGLDNVIFLSKGGGGGGLGIDYGGGGGVKNSEKMRT